MVGLTAFGAYLPRRRLSRKAIADANQWFNPGLRGAAKGERAMANWDEDPITMAVEAARDCLGEGDRSSIDAVRFASTTMPFADRQNAGIVAAALNLPEAVSAVDISGSQRAGLSALRTGLDAVAAGSAKDVLVASGEKRLARVASSQEMQFGDGAAAFRIGKDKEIARYLGGASRSIEFIDHFRAEGEEFDYNWEERWIRDEGLVKIVPPAIKSALENAGVKPVDIKHFIFPSLFAGMPQTLAKQAGIAPEAVRDTLAVNVGETGTAHALLMLVDALENAKPGDKILAASFGQGVDVLIFEVTPALADLPKRKGLKGSLAHRKEETTYMRFLAFNELVPLDKGMRAEKDNKVALTTLYRNRDMLFGLKGGKCRKCGTAQFPRSRMCVNPNCKAVDSQDPYDFSDKKGKVLSWSADFLTFTMDPPAHYGMVTFEEGGRFIADFTDVDPGMVDTGISVRMVFRVKDYDRRRNFRTYFWKAVPV